MYKLRNQSNLILIGSAIVLFSIGICIQYLGHFEVFLDNPILDKITKYPLVHRNFLFYGLPFLSIGYVMRKTNFHTKFSKTKVLLFLVFGLVLLAIDSLINYHYLSYKVVVNMHITFLIAAPALFMTAFTFHIPSSANSKILSSYSIAIYLVHPLIIVLITTIFNQGLSPTVLTLATIIGAILISYLLIELNKKVKYLL